VQQVARLDEQALDVSTLDKPRWRRTFFVIAISLLLLAYLLTRWVRYRTPRDDANDREKKEEKKKKQ
jgi:membrane protein implicated in regulation of membrane protease activity